MPYIFDKDTATYSLKINSNGSIDANVVAFTSTVTVHTGTVGSVIVKSGTAANLNMTEASASDIKTAVEIMDDWDESTNIDKAMVGLIPANCFKGSTVSMATGDATKTDEIDLPARACILTKVVLDFSNHYRANTISVERENSGGTLQQYIVDTTDKLNDTGYIELPVWITCAASDKIEINVTNTASEASELDWRIHYIDPSPPSS